jgi:LysR family glycine cleavage system transcriptional activator
MRPPLPPLAAVRVFEAAARHKSFTRAAEELGMTQAAVSYQIKVLEDRAGAALFQRLPRGVALTDMGARFSIVASDALDKLSDGFSAAIERSEETLVLSVISTFATNILAQRSSLSGLMSIRPWQILNLVKSTLQSGWEMAIGRALSAISCSRQFLRQC